MSNNRYGYSGTTQSDSQQQQSGYGASGNSQVVSNNQQNPSQASTQQQYHATNNVYGNQPYQQPSHTGNVYNNQPSPSAYGSTTGNQNVSQSHHGVFGSSYHEHERKKKQKSLFGQIEDTIKHTLGMKHK